MSRFIKIITGKAMDQFYNTRVTRAYLIFFININMHPIGSPGAVGHHQELQEGGGA
jgi:hypothetical protein